MYPVQDERNPQKHYLVKTSDKKNQLREYCPTPYESSVSLLFFIQPLSFHFSFLTSPGVKFYMLWFKFAFGLKLIFVNQFVINFSLFQIDQTDWINFKPPKQI